MIKGMRLRALDAFVCPDTRTKAPFPPSQTPFILQAGGNGACDSIGIAA